MLKASASGALAAHLTPGNAGHPWPAEVKSGAIDRFNSTSSTTVLTLVERLVVEVSADTAFSGSSFRHALRCPRPRPELDPTSVVLPEYLDLAVVSEPPPLTQRVRCQEWKSPTPSAILMPRPAVPAPVAQLTTYYEARAALDAAIPKGAQLLGIPRPLLRPALPEPAR